MRIPILVPDLRCENEPLCVSGWLVDEGDLILAGDFIVELRIPAVTFDILSEMSGRVVTIEKLADSPIKTGDILGWLDDGIDEVVPAEQEDKDTPEQES
ncbi:MULTISPECIES: biotin/lipoyl-containing protein [unclassified Schlesneria]|uniref:biotin/lipoyl-containing protein n=1 Tax=unclassified Schlesneria TaxID=2762017 RepID=UPI002EFC8268